MKTRKTDFASLALLAATTLVVAACGGGGGGGDDPDYPMNSAPTITGLSDKATNQDTAISVEFSVDDRDTGAGSLTVAATADSGAVYPADSMVISGSGAMRTLTLTPLEATGGTATITIRVTDPQGASSSGSFQVAVNVVNRSIRDAVFEAFGKGETDTAIAMNGWNAVQDVKDLTDFAPLIPEGDE